MQFTFSVPNIPLVLQFYTRPMRCARTIKKWLNFMPQLTTRTIHHVTSYDIKLCQFQWSYDFPTANMRVKVKFTFRFRIFFHIPHFSSTQILHTCPVQPPPPTINNRIPIPICLIPIYTLTQSLKFSVLFVNLIKNPYYEKQVIK